ncbi:MAG: tyrosine-protein phosphatase [Bacteroidales bacterium]|nr:tyrosine-protein phosphatase [Candidatus Cacconaster merdequi]
MTYDFNSQSLGLVSVANARELGGYVLPNGKKIKKGLLLRGGSLAAVSAEDAKALSERYRLARIFDFRTDMEVRHSPDAQLPGVGNIWLPAIDPESEKLGAASLPEEAYRDLVNYLVEKENAFNPTVQEIARHIYSEMVLNEYTQLQYAAFLQMISATPTGAVYWHCSQGKDRTGLGAAFLLAALGADRDLIMADYAISNDFYRKEIAAVTAMLRAKKGPDAEAEKAILTFIGANEEYFEASLDLIDKKFGSMESYLKGPLCMTDLEMNRLRSRYLE